MPDYVDKARKAQQEHEQKHDVQLELTDSCGLCGKTPAAGFAMIGDIRYCHGDFDPEPTCYMQSQWRLSRGL